MNTSLTILIGALIPKNGTDSFTTLTLAPVVLELYCIVINPMIFKSSSVDVFVVCRNISTLLALTEALTTGVYTYSDQKTVSEQLLFVQPDQITFEATAVGFGWASVIALFLSVIYLFGQSWAAVAFLFRGIVTL